jgi:hypothetical protein
MFVKQELAARLLAAKQILQTAEAAFADATAAYTAFALSYITAQAENEKNIAKAEAKNNPADNAENIAKAEKISLRPMQKTQKISLRPMQKTQSPAPIPIEMN